MEYIVIFDPDLSNVSIMESSNNFIETYSNYEDAKAEAESWKEAGDCRSYGIYAKCSDDKNYLV